MRRTGVAFSPCQITGFFQIHDDSRDPAKVGSTGAGVCIEQGVRTRVVLDTRKATQIRLNGQPLSRPVVSTKVLEHFRKLAGSINASIDHDCPLPVGCGYGTSGAGALSLALAFNSALGEPLRREEAGMVAHLSEVEARTGLGTVISEYNGGVVVRTRPGGPGVGRVRRLRFPSSMRIISGTFGPFRKSRVIGSASLSYRVNLCGRNLVSTFLRQSTHEKFLGLSSRFTECLSLGSRKLAIASKRVSSEGIRPGMMMLGDSLFSIVDEDTVERARMAFAGAGFEPVVSRINYHGARSI